MEDTRGALRGAQQVKELSMQASGLEFQSPEPHDASMLGQEAEDRIPRSLEANKTLPQMKRRVNSDTKAILWSLHNVVAYMQPHKREGFCFVLIFSYLIQKSTCMLFL